VFDGSQTGNDNRLKIYQNAVQQLADFIIDNYTVPATTSANTGLEYIGTHGVTASSWRWLGYIDEFRISSVARSAAYNKFMYNNITAPQTSLLWTAFNPVVVKPSGLTIYPLAIFNNNNV
jgi:hypothetical protein